MLVLPAAFGLLSRTHTAQAGEPTGTISGIVFEDRNENGLRDPEDDGVGVRVVYLVLKNKTDPEWAASAWGSGQYKISGLPPGEYPVHLEEVQSKGQCVDYAFTFNPLRTSYCIGKFELPWHATTPNPVTVSVPTGETSSADFGIAPDDVAVLTGIALLQEDRAPDGTLIEALVGDSVCGAAETKAGGEVDFVINVRGASQQSGCAQPGDAVQFRVGGIAAAETYVYRPFVDRLDYYGGLQYQGLSAVTSHAWYWFERYSRPAPADGLLIEAFVGDTVCGQTRLQVRAGPAGFSRLLVCSAERQPGCAEPGSSVAFRVNGLRAETMAAWQPGVQEIDLLVRGDANCDFAIDARDATLVLQQVASLVTSTQCDADANHDQRVDSLDALQVLQYAAGLTGQIT